MNILKKAIQKYYNNRSLQGIQCWDKDKDLDDIFKAARKLGYDYSEACAGTFWFHRGARVWSVNKESFPKMKRLSFKKAE